MTSQQRRVLLNKLLQAIKSGEFNSSYPNWFDLFKSNPPAPGRQEYLPPVQRDSLNYGYMTSGEIGSGNLECR